MTTSPTPLWSPSPERVAASNLMRFLQEANARHGLDLKGYDDLYAWSIEAPEPFWRLVWDFTGIRASAAPGRVLASRSMPGAEWFPGARLNFAENLLRHRDHQPALVSWSESGRSHVLTYAQLYEAVCRFASFLRASGVRPGDRVAGFLPNRPEAVVAMLATASLGAVWSSCSPDFGFQGVIDRFGQIEPKVLVACDGYVYGDRAFSCVQRVEEVAATIGSIERSVIVPVLGEPVTHSITWQEANDRPVDSLVFEQVPFDHPLYILYSSGTTGVPKCIVHGVGGTLLQHAKELVFHVDLKRDDTLFYFTTCGWMMWNWLVSGLFTGSTLVLYDGNPAFPDLGTLWRMAEQEGITVFGTSPKYLAAVRKAGLQPGRAFQLARLRAVLSTGSPLSAELFEWVYETVSRDLQLASICGGTDIISCFMLGSPISPVYAGEIQKRGLGMKVEAWAENGEPVVGRKGELVCTAPFPSMPVGFWNDPNGTRYRRAYFEHYPGVWRHGDYVEITERGGVVVYGRSDATLNPGGVRIGTAEIYRIVEGLDEVVDSIVIGQRQGADVAVVLFVVLAPGVELDPELTHRIKRAIRTEATPRHVPAKVLAVPEIPRTISGKKVELAVSRIVHGEEVTNRDALANPEALEHFSYVSR